MDDQEEGTVPRGTHKAEPNPSRASRASHEAAQQRSSRDAKALDTDTRLEEPG